jgi:hypothetical protein
MEEMVLLSRAPASADSIPMHLRLPVLLAVMGDGGVSRSMLTPRAFRLEEPFPVRTDL